MGVPLEIVSQNIVLLIKNNSAGLNRCPVIGSSDHFHLLWLLRGCLNEDGPFNGGIVASTAADTPLDDTPGPNNIVIGDHRPHGRRTLHRHSIQLRPDGLLPPRDHRFGLLHKLLGGPVPAMPQIGLREQMLNQFHLDILHILPTLPIFDVQVELDDLALLEVGFGEVGSKRCGALVPAATDLWAGRRGQLRGQLEVGDLHYGQVQFVLGLFVGVFGGG